MAINSIYVQNKVWGAAYLVKDNVTDRGGNLDYREKRFDKREIVSFYPGDVSPPQECLVFLGTSDSSLILGPAPVADMAHQICTTEGPSGTSLEYFEKLLFFLKTEAPLSVHEDEDIFEIEKCISSM